jgi:hypothetical protein
VKDKERDVIEEKSAITIKEILLNDKNSFVTFKDFMHPVP